MEDIIIYEDQVLTAETMDEFVKRISTDLIDIYELCVKKQTISLHIEMPWITFKKEEDFNKFIELVNELIDGKYHPIHDCRDDGFYSALAIGVGDVEVTLTTMEMIEAS